MYYKIDLKTLDLTEHEKYPAPKYGDLSNPFRTYEDKTLAHKSLLLLLLDRSLKTLREHIALQTKIVQLTQLMEPKKEETNEPRSEGLPSNG